MTNITTSEIIGVLLFACGGALVLQSIYSNNWPYSSAVNVIVSGFKFSNSWCGTLVDCKEQ
jgi:hypothetical protein